ncbi:MAG: amino acid permease [Candidatus Brocadiia bacterium]
MATQPSKLKKGLSLRHVFCIASGAMISSGLFVLPGMAHKIAGPGVIWSYLLAGILATAGALSIAELTTAMPKAGGDYFFITRGFGPGVGTVAGILSWFSLSLKSAFAIVGMAGFLALIVSVNGVLAGGILCAIFVGLNLIGVREAARAQLFLVTGLFALLAYYVITGIPKMNSELLVPFAPRGLVPIFTATGFVFISYGGLLNVASVAEEVRNPGRNIPLGLILSLVSVTIIYTLVVVVTSGVLANDVLDGSLQPISDGGQALMGRTGYILMSIGAILAFISTANAGIMSASRYLLALSRDKLIPSPLSNVNERFNTPHMAILLTGFVILLCLFLELKTLVEAASTVLILTNILACLSIVVLRESGLQNYRPAFRSPLYPWLQIGGVLGLGFVLSEIGIDAYFISAGLILIGFLGFWFYGRQHVKRESALLHLIERITARELVTGTLEEELKNIIHERDEVVRDRFDKLVETCPVLDLEREHERGEVFELAGEELSSKLGLSTDEIATALAEREAQSSTAVNRWLAIPHIIVDGEDKFELVLVRSSGGIYFSDEAPEVKAMFFLVGTMDRRNFHLFALSAIAQVTGNPGFLERWLKAKNERALRDVLLLGQRQRSDTERPGQGLNSAS